METLCRKCHSIVAYEEGYSPWCRRCDWNLSPYHETSGKHISVKIKLLVNQLINQIIYKLHKNKTIASRNVSLLGIIRNSVSLVLIMIHILLIVGSLYLAYISYEQKALIIVVLLLILSLGLILMMFPKTLEEGNLYKPIIEEQFSDLYGITKKICEILNIDAIDEIVLTAGYEASIELNKQKKILIIGVPLFLVLTESEKIALISHELAHLKNRDFDKNRLMHYTKQLVSQWFILWGNNNGGTDNEAVGLTVFKLIIGMIQVLLFFVFIPIYIVGKGLLLIADLNYFHKMEYLADFVGAQVSGTKAMLELLDKFHLQQVFNEISRNSSLGGLKNAMHQFENKYKYLPELEKERSRRINLLYTYQGNHGHPPTKFRMEKLQNTQFKPLLSIDQKSNKSIEDMIRSAII